MNHIDSGTGPPSSTPDEVGHHYIDLTAAAHYVSVGTASAADWQLQAGSGATGNFTYAGSPEGNVTASVGARCWDSVNDVDYIKKTGSGNTGWG